jgi:hypothetical protein
MMTEDDIITRLVDLHDHIQAPATEPRQDALRGERLVRRRRTLSVLAAAVVVLAVGVAQAALLDDRRTMEPARQPRPSVATSPTTSEEWTPERIRALRGGPGWGRPSRATPSLFRPAAT